MTWLKSIGSALVAAAIAFGIFMAANAASNERRKARQWQERALDEVEASLTDDIELANAALTQAKLHDAKAEEAIAKGKARLDKLGSRHEDVADIVDRWRKPDSG